MKQWAVFLGLAGMALAAEQITVVDRPDTHFTNSFYVSSRPPLEPSRFIELPAGSIKPAGWLRTCLLRQRDGLTGNLGKISAWLQKEDNAWLDPNGRGKWGWEEVPYWLRGYGELAYILNDPQMIAETKVWIEGALRSQRDNGDFGPDQRFNDGTRDYWANMLMLYCLQSYYEYSKDQRVLDLMTRYFKHQSSVPDEQLLTGYWQRMRGGDNLYSIYWLYNRTGEQWLLEAAEKIHRNTADWRMEGDLPNWHNVNIAQAFDEPAVWFLQSRNPADLEFAYRNFRTVRWRFGQVPGGMFGGDENCRVGYDDPRQCIETCGMIEQMLSDEMLMRISGDPFWADHCEEVAFNSYPAALMPDFRSLRYLTAPNMVASDRYNHRPGIDNGGPFLLMNPFSSRCCQHNHSHGWPYYAKNLWLASPDNGLCASLYAASEVKAKVGDGTEITLHQETHYPFEEQIRLTLLTEKPVRFPLYLRIPGWCENPALQINGMPRSAAARPRQYIRIDRLWTSGDVIVLNLPMAIRLHTWIRNHNSVTVSYGPLAFSLKIKENYVKLDSTKTAVSDSQWQAGADPSQWPSYEILPASAWNYGLVLDKDNPAGSFKLIKKIWPDDDFPFTLDTVPLEMTASAKKIPNWAVDQFGLCAPLQDSPVRSDEPTETITLVPMGAARLRISAFPTIGQGPEAHEWKPTPPAPRPADYKTSASHIFDELSALCDGIVPASSDDHSIPRFTWWDHQGTKEWVQYDFDQPRTVSEVSVYWFDDTGIGRCRIPRSWRLLYRDAEAWKPVEKPSDYGTASNAWNTTSFAAVQTASLRLEVQLRPGFSGGILEWKVK